MNWYGHKRNRIAILGIVLGFILLAGMDRFANGSWAAANGVDNTRELQAVPTATPTPNMTATIQAATATCRTVVNVFLLLRPGNAGVYQTTGSVRAGEEVIVLGGNRQNGNHTYYKVVADNGEPGWLPSIFCPIADDESVGYLPYPIPYTATPDSFPGTATATVLPQKTPKAPTSVPPDTITPSPNPDITNTPQFPPDTVTPTFTSIPPATPTATPILPDITPTKRPRSNACVRINFEVSGDYATRGLYVVRETGGKLLASWYALDGWKDSGWFKEIDITHENVFVEVLYYHGPDARPIYMDILNHAPGTKFGWMSWGVCHALEVAWPGEKPEGATVSLEEVPLEVEQVEQAAPSVADPPKREEVTEEEQENRPASASLNS